VPLDDPIYPKPATGGTGTSTLPSFGGYTTPTGTPYAQPTQQPITGNNPYDPRGNPDQWTTQQGMGFTYGMDPMSRLLGLQLLGLQGDERMAGTLLQNQIAQANSLRDFNTNALSTQYGFDARTLAENQYRDVDLKRQQEAQALRNVLAGLGSQYSNIARLDVHAGDVYGNQQQDLASLLARLNRERTSSWTGANENLALAGQRRDLGSQVNLAGFNQNSRANNSNATAAGSMLSAGYRDSRNELANQLNLADRDVSLQYQGASNTYDQSLRDIQNRFSAGVDSYDSGQRDAALGYKKSLGDNAFQREQLRLDEDARKAQNKQVNAMLDSVAREYGIKRENLSFTLQNGIDRLGIDLQQTLAGLARDFNSENAQRRAQAQMLAGQIMEMGQLSGQKPSTPPMIPSQSAVPSANLENTVARLPLIPDNWLSVDQGVTATRSRTSTKPIEQFNQELNNFTPGFFSTDPDWQAEARRRGLI
jgi:hypothetical protein